MTYAPQHASSLALLARKGAAVSFTFTTNGTLDEATGLDTGASTSTVSGQAVRVQGDPKVYEQLGLKEIDSPTLVFAPTTRGQLPSMDWKCTWASTVYTVARVFPVAPDAAGAIVARVVLKR